MSLLYLLYVELYTGVIVLVLFARGMEVIVQGWLSKKNCNPSHDKECLKVKKIT